MRVTRSGRAVERERPDLLTMTERKQRMRSRNTRRVAALAAACWARGSLLASCADDGDGGGSPRAAPGPEPTRPSARTSSSWPTSATCPAKRSRSTPRSWPPRTRPRRTPTSCSTDVHRRQGQLRGLQGVRGPAAGPRARPATRRTSPTSRSPACSRPWSRHRQGGRGALAGRPTTSTSASARTGRPTARVDGKFYAAPLGANVKSFVWYSPTMFAENGWDGPDDLGRDDRALRHDRRHGHQAVVRRHRVR